MMRKKREYDLAILVMAILMFSMLILFLALIVFFVVIIASVIF
jgi:hypothetical protein